MVVYLRLQLQTSLENSLTLSIETKAFQIVSNRLEYPAAPEYPATQTAVIDFISRCPNKVKSLMVDPLCSILDVQKYVKCEINLLRLPVATLSFPERISHQLRPTTSSNALATMNVYTSP